LLYSHKSFEVATAMDFFPDCKAFGWHRIENDGRVIGFPGRFEPCRPTGGNCLRSFDEMYSEEHRIRDLQEGKRPLFRTIVQQSIQTGIRYLLNFYYFMKPALPASLRSAVRRYHAIPLKWTSASTWPINKASGGKPANWPGWPDGKQFAFVLSHDVEGKKGLERSRSLAELEMKLCYRSCFNFVPEGEYETPRELRTFLTENGFEVGVHDLHHDGSLYRSQDVFDKSALKINQYLDDWNAVGFRSGFMRHDLDWISKLHIRYDASTFDSDPFEPQPDGMQTIFPFWVRRPDQTTYLELPYTLAQDSTLFLVLREKNNDVWKRKLAWIADHGGMAFVIVHPDYMEMEGTSSPREYDADLYRNFLKYTREKYGDTAWFARPCDVERYLRYHFPSEGNVERPYMPASRTMPARQIR